MIFRMGRCPCMKIFFDVRVARHLGIGVLVAAATFGFASSAYAVIRLGSPNTTSLSNGLDGSNIRETATVGVVPVFQEI